MKKILVILAMVAFVGSISAPVFASDNSTPVTTVDDKPTKKAESEKKSEKKEGCSSTCGSKTEKSCGDKDKK
jgi:hypothetical protein